MSYINSPPQISIPIAGQDSTFLVHRIFCVGRNYYKHIAEMGYEETDIPFVYFMKPPEAIGINNSTISIPSFTKNFQYEVELVIAIDTEGSNITSTTAHEHIYGYAVGIDLTCRDIQKEAKKQGKPWTLAKSIPDSAPISSITPVKECGYIKSGTIQLSVNGEERQKSDVKNMIRNPAVIINELSKIYTLFPGDIIFTGTPEGVGKITSGDIIAAKIDGLEPLSCSFI